MTGTAADQVELPVEAHAAVATVLRAHERLLLLAASGLDRRPLLSAAAQFAVERKIRAWWVDADPGMPTLGPPGAISLACGAGAGWKVETIEPLCSLDAARFRLPLIQAVARLVSATASDRLLINAPGLFAGVAGAELITALAAHAGALVVLGEPASTAFAPELAASNLPVYRWSAPADPSSANAGTRAKARTHRWERYLEDSRPARISRTALHELGTPPGSAVDAESWVGRQIALGHAGAWLAFGEVLAVDKDILDLRMVGNPAGADRLLVRDAGRDANGELRTVPPVSRAVSAVGKVKQVTRAQTEVRCGPVLATLANGVTGDPLLLLRLRHRRATLMFDVGECQQISRRLLHTVTDLFLTHAHLDHVAGFTYLLRSRLSAMLPPLHIYGPPGTRDHIAGFLAGVRWDRIGDDGPEFVVNEIDGDSSTSWCLKVGRDPAPGRTQRIDGCVLRTPDYEVSATALDHGIPVLTYAIQLAEQRNVDTSALAARRLPAGPWLGELKANVNRGARDALVRLPDGSQALSGELADALLHTRHGPKIVYATDFADHADNRARLSDFARGAELLVCEATFRTADGHLAADTQHLTTRACGEIADAARVARLLPFHISKRYEGKLDAVYEEIVAASGSVDVIRHAEAR